MKDRVATEDETKAAKEILKSPNGLKLLFDAVDSGKVDREVARHVYAQDYREYESSWDRRIVRTIHAIFE